MILSELQWLAKERGMGQMRTKPLNEVVIITLCIFRVRSKASGGPCNAQVCARPLPNNTERVIYWRHGHDQYLPKGIIMKNHVGSCHSLCRRPLNYETKRADCMGEIGGGGGKNIHRENVAPQRDGLMQLTFCIL